MAAEERRRKGGARDGVVADGLSAALKTGSDPSSLRSSSFGVGWVGLCSPRTPFLFPDYIGSSIRCVISSDVNLYEGSEVSIGPISVFWFRFPPERILDVRGGPNRQTVTDWEKEGWHRGSYTSCRGGSGNESRSERDRDERRHQFESLSGANSYGPVEL